jgi:hypothetical protein
MRHMLALLGVLLGALTVTAAASCGSNPPSLFNEGGSKGTGAEGGGILHLGSDGGEGGAVLHLGGDGGAEGSATSVPDGAACTGVLWALPGFGWLGSWV